MSPTVRRLAPWTFGGFVGLFGAIAQAEVRTVIVPQTSASNVELVLGETPPGLEAAEMLQVFVGASVNCCDGKTPMSGRHTLSGGLVTFDPAFDFLQGQPYTIRTWQGSLTEFSITATAALATPEVLNIAPSGTEIPENTLRFYIEFSVPMMPHRSEEFITLVDAKGNEDRAAFMTFKQELWNADRTRLTLLMDPGRIKRGVAQNLSLGPALREGENYKLLIREGWPSADGRLNAPRFEKTFAVSPALRSLPKVADWHVSTPRRGTSDPLTITFDRPFDSVQTLDSIFVRDAHGRPMLGEVSLDHDQRTWRFRPAGAWSSTAYEIVVDARLEDVAGNNFRDTLDHALGTDVRAVDQVLLPLKLAPAGG